MKQFASSIIGLAAASAFFLIVSVDQQSNVTARVLDGSIFPLVDRAQTQIHNGIEDRHEAAAAANKVYLRRHCSTQLRFEGVDSTGCGYTK